MRTLHARVLLQGARTALSLPARALSTTAAAAAAAPTARPSAQLLAQLKAAPAFCFDVDSTVITTEGIDELAAFAGRKAQVAALTAQAMGGSMPFERALEARLRLIAPTRALLAAFLAAHPPAFTPGLQAVVAALHARGAHVYLVSGGFTQMIHPVAAALGVARERVFANTILFEAAGEGAYAGFDASAPTSRDGGKAEVMRALKARHGYAPLVMVGDGATDLQARAPGAADVMLGYGGIAQREAVVKGACWYFRDFAELQPLL